MVATTRPPEDGGAPPLPYVPPNTVVRFARAERVFHWVNATLFAVVIFTAAVLYLGPLSVVVGRRELVRTVHVYCGLAIPLVFLISAIGPWGAPLRADLRRINAWTTDDRRWWRAARRGTKVRLGKFNPGQKLNAAFLAAATVVMLATGSIMRWFEHFPVDWRTGATFAHDWFALAIGLAIIGHIAFALRDPEALRAMLRGRISASWARRERPRWYEETTGRRDTDLQ